VIPPFATVLPQYRAGLACGEDPEPPVEPPEDRSIGRSARLFVDNV